jgi:hypothetical protein
MDKLTYERIDDSTVRIDGKEYVERKEDMREYYYIDRDGSVILAQRGPVADKVLPRIISYGNRFDTNEKAQAVSDLRRHVVKFKPMPNFYWYDGYEWVKKCVFSDLHIFRSPDRISNDSTEQDRAERLRLIKRCDELGVLQFVI